MCTTGTRKWYGERSSRHPLTPLHGNGSSNLKPQNIPGPHGNSLWTNMRYKKQLTSGYFLRLGFSPSFQTTGGHYIEMSTSYHSRSTALSFRRGTLCSPVTRILFRPIFEYRGCLMDCRYQTHLPLIWPSIMLLTIYCDIGWDPSPTCPPRWKSNSLQGQKEGEITKVIVGSPNLTPREYVTAAD